MIFIMMGGSGSTFVEQHMVDMRVPYVHKRIDVMMKPRWYKQDNLNPIYNLQELPSEQLLNDFGSRAHWHMHPGYSIKDNLDQYYKKAADDKNCFSLACGFLSCFNYFYENENINDMVYIFRHPLHHAIAYFGPQKSHGVELERDFSSIFTTEGLDMYIKYYNKVVTEALKMKQENRAKICLFEDDLSKVDFGHWKFDTVFELWKGDSRHPNKFNKEQEEYLKKNIMWEELFEEWVI